MGALNQHLPSIPSSKEEGKNGGKAPSSLEEGVGGGGVSRDTLRKRAAQMRQHMPEPERRLWAELRGKRFQGHKFRRQMIIGNRIVDFFCSGKGLVIEVDGDTHDFQMDARRDEQMMAEHGFATIRFSNADVIGNLDGVLERLAAVLEAAPDRWLNGGRHHSQTPSEEEGA